MVCLQRILEVTNSSDLTFTDSIGLGGGVCTGFGHGTPKTFAARFARHHFRYPLLIILDPPLRIANNLCHHSSGSSFDGVTFNTGNIPYDQVCGRVIAYQKGSTDAFNVFINRTIDNAYVDGVSITHGFPRQHIWSFAAGIAEITVLDSSSLCPCSLNSTNGPNVPTNVENNYFCDTGTITNNGLFTSYLDDPLWDGQGCGPSSSCCSFNSTPWFNVRLPNATTDGIEVRLGIDYASQSTEDILLELLVIYIR